MSDDFAAIKALVASTGPLFGEETLPPALYPRFGGVPYTANQLYTSSLEFIANVRKSIDQMDGQARNRVILESFYTRHAKSGAQILAIVAERGLTEVGMFVLSLLDQNPLCPEVRYTKTATSSVDLEQETLFALSDFGFSQLSEQTIKNLPHPLSMTWNGKSPLAIAVENRHVPIVRLFLAKGADPNQFIQTGVGFSASTIILHTAVWGNDNTEIIKALLECPRTDIDASMHDTSTTAFYVAVQNNRYDYAKLLFDAGANVNKTPQGESILAALTTSGQFLGFGGSTERLAATSEYLLSLADPSIPESRRVDIFARDRITHGGVLHAFAKSSISFKFVLKLLELANKLDPPDPNFILPSAGQLTLGSLKGAGGAARLLNVRDNSGSTPLLSFIGSSNFDLNADNKNFESLMDFMGNISVIDTPNLQGTTPLMASLCSQSQGGQWLKLLIKHGADVNANASTGNILAKGLRPNYLNQHMLLQYTPADVFSKISELLDVGADINAANPTTGQTIGHTTVIENENENESCEIVKFLLKEGLDPEIRDNDGYTLVHRAAKKGLVTLIANLANRCDIHAKVGNNNGQSIVHLLKISSKARPTNRSGRMTADSNAVEKMFVALKKIGCDLDAVDSKGNTALHTWASELNESNLRALVSIGCDPNVKNYAGETALDVAIRLLAQCGDRTQTFSHTQTQISSSLFTESNFDILQRIVKFLTGVIQGAVQHKLEKAGGHRSSEQKNQNSHFGQNNAPSFVF